MVYRYYAICLLYSFAQFFVYFVGFPLAENSTLIINIEAYLVENLCTARYQF